MLGVGDGHTLVLRRAYLEVLWSNYEQIAYLCISVSVACPSHSVVDAPVTGITAERRVRKR